MPGNVIGGQKAAATNKRKYGQGFYNRIGKLGGAAGKGHKFAHGKFSPQEAGRLGGGVSKRGKAAPKEVFFVADDQIDSNIIEPFNKQPWHKGWIKRSK